MAVTWEGTDHNTMLCNKKCFLNRETELGQDSPNSQTGAQS